MAGSEHIPQIDGIEGLELVGRGGFAVVYRGHQSALRRDVAVKVLQRSGLDADDRRRFDRECQAMGALSDHPGIVTLYSAGFTAEEQPYLVMAYVRDGTLHDRLVKQGRMSWQDATALGVRLSGALETAHRVGVLHRDIKPGNVLCSEYGDQLSDFGIARIQGGHETQSGVITASLAHAAPEALDGQRPTAQADVYGLASTIYEAINGTAAFVRDTDEGMLPLLLRVMNDPPPSLQSVGVPDAVAAVIETGMAKDPAQRFDSAEAFGLALQVAQKTVGIPVTELAIVAAKPDGPAGPAAEATLRSTADVAKPDDAPPPIREPEPAAPADGNPPPDATIGGAPLHEMLGAMQAAQTAGATTGSVDSGAKDTTDRDTTGSAWGATRGTTASGTVEGATTGPVGEATTGTTGGAAASTTAGGATTGSTTRTVIPADRGAQQPPTEPKDSGGPNKMVLLGGALVAAVVLVIGFVVLSGGGDDPSNDADDQTTDQASSTTDASATSTIAEETTTTTSVATTVAEPEVQIGLLAPLVDPGDALVVGLKDSSEGFGVSLTESDPELGAAEVLSELVAAGQDPIIAIAQDVTRDDVRDAIAASATANPEVTFVVLDAEVDAPNVVSLTFAEQDGSFLMGVVAASTSTTGRVGFLGGADNERIQRYEAGFVDGVRFASPVTQIDVRYLPGAGELFADTEAARVLATEIYGGGADIIYHAGTSGNGVFQAASEAPDRWVIGVETDQAVTADPAVRDVILTSLVKRYDDMAQEALAAAAEGQLTPGVFARTFDQNAFEISGTGEHIDQLVLDEIDPLIQQIVDGQIVVPAAVERRALAPLGSACPEEGCQIRILGAEPSGSELALTLEANWILNTGARHAHYFWSPRYTAEQVGGNSAARFGVSQGSWNLSDAYPVYVTAGAASLSGRGDDVDLCVTAADGGHNVIDPALFDCIAVADIIGN